MRKVFLDDLPRLSNGFISWKDSVGYILRFVYDAVDGEFQILDYQTNGVSPKVFLRYQNNEEWVYTSRIVNAKIGNFIKVKKKNSQQNSENLIGQRFGKLVVIEDDGTRSREGGIKWHCLCDCGGETHVIGTKLKSGHTKTCGCGARVFFKPKSTTTHELRNTATSRILGRYKSKAKDRNLHWGISKELFIKTIEKPCYYCGTEGSLSLVIDDFEYLHNGIDRIDSDKGYEASNIVPCCKNCNMAKSNMSQSDFYNWITNAADFIRANRLNKD